MCIRDSPYYDCPQGLQESCGTSDMYQNFMDFTDDRCLAAFTHDQVMMMQTTAAAFYPCLLYTSDAADERSSVDLGGRRIIKKKNVDD